DGRVVVGIPRAVLQNNFVKAIEVEIEFVDGDTGSFELRYSAKSIKDPALIDHRLFGLMLDSSTMQPMKGNMPVPVNKKFTARAVLNTPSPDPQVIIVLKPKNKNEAPHIKSLTYKIWTTPAMVVIRGFNWTK
ncbi:MAG: VCBS repeat-containing protein, partial [Fervidobacterium sp.]